LTDRRILPPRVNTEKHRRYEQKVNSCFDRECSSVDERNGGPGFGHGSKKRKEGRRRSAKQQYSKRGTRMRRLRDSRREGEKAKEGGRYDGDQGRDAGG
jgi:hypothetical protein